MQCLEEVIGHEHDDDGLLPLVLRDVQLNGLGQLESLDLGD